MKICSGCLFMSGYKQLYQDLIKQLDNSNLIQRAYKSVLYHEKWKKRIDDITKLQGYEGLSKLPYVSADDLRIIWEKHSVEEIILTETVGFWYTTSGSMGNKKWIPWTFGDYNKAGLGIAKNLLNYLDPTDRILIIMLPPPFISGSSPFKLLENTGDMGTPIEVLAFSPEYIQDGFGLLMKRRPNVVIGTPSLVLRMAEEIAINTPLLLKERAEEEKSIKLRIAAAATKLKKIYPKHIFRKMKYGYFGGESLDPFRKAIEDKWGLEAFDVYAFTEGFSGGFECTEHNGMHFPSPFSIIEIIPESELAIEADDPEYTPEAVIVTEAEEGLTGELVLTDFKEALPMIRFRVRDSVKVVSTGDCSCGLDSPRLKIIGRTDSVINIGIIRLSAIIFDQLLRKDFKFGKVNLWEVYVTREKYRPKLVLTIEPEFVKNEEEFKKELFDSLHGFDLFQRGYDNGLFLFDEIKFVDKLKLEIYGQGKSRVVRYDPDFNKAVKM
ncbi:MAG: phenylacetate--CoA ligase family protein [Asgard group archaeon]|nr:phenylacetate--CoA ligase family protein [Asgard group archaeon]